jgi:guanine deaminase
MIGAIEAVRSGTTTLGDDANVGAVINPEHVDAVVQAYEDIGVRAYVGVTLFDKPFIRAVPFVEEEVPPAMLRELEAMPMMRSGERLDFVRDGLHALDIRNSSGLVAWFAHRRRNGALRRFCATAEPSPMTSTFL